MRFYCDLHIRCIRKYTPEVHTYYKFMFTKWPFTAWENHKHSDTDTSTYISIYHNQSLNKPFLKDVLTEHRVKRKVHKGSTWRKFPVKTFVHFMIHTGLYAFVFNFFFWSMITCRRKVIPLGDVVTKYRLFIYT